MIITTQVFDIIQKFSSKSPYEIGGILGSSSEKVITDIVIDIPEKHRGSKLEYSPNISFLNNEIKRWTEKDIVFFGLFHSHFFNSSELSIADVSYIKEIMGCVPENTILYFPIFSLPKRTLTAYRAYVFCNDLVIENESIEFFERGYKTWKRKK